MSLHTLLPESPRERRRLWSMTLIFGLFTTLNFGLTAQALGRDMVVDDLFLVALIALSISTLARQDALLRLVIALESRIQQLRQGLIEKLPHIPLSRYEQLGAIHLHRQMSHGTRLLSELNGVISKLFILGVRGIALLLALYWISAAAFSFVLCLLLMLCALLIWAHLQGYAPVHSGAEVRQRSLTRAYDDLVYGFNALKLDPARGARLQASIGERLQALLQMRTREHRWVAMNYVSAEGAMLLLGGTLLFVLPALNDDLTAVAVTATVVALCLPTSLLRDIPQLSGASQALGKLQALERELETALRATPEAEAEPDIEAEPTTPRFTRLDIQQLSYRYTHSGGDGFALGPLDLEVEAGGIYFIVGGNGSGKTTLFKLLTGLYPWERGRLLIDGEQAGRARQSALVAPIFYDAYLFDRLYGRTPDAAMQADAEAYLERMEIAHKVRLEGDRFSTLDLSVGQRKRLVLVQALLEGKPLLLLDEWAADQDPAFRHRFYTELLPWLRSEGRTVVAITHDDRYFHTADRIFQLERGRWVDPAPRPFNAEETPS